MALIEKSIWNFAKIKWLDQFMTCHKGFIAGGCFKNIFSGEKVKDIDVFFESAADWESAVEYFDSEYGEDNKGGTYRFYYENKKVKAYKHLKTNITVELICNVYGTAEQILNQFDFTITKFAYAKREIEDEDGFFPDDEKHTKIEYFVLLDDCFFEHLQLKRLVIDNNVFYPVSTFDRMFRYAKYGYFPCRDTKLKIIDELRKLEKIDGLSESLYDGID